MGDEPSKLEWDLLAWEDSIESERERIGEIKDRLEKIEENYQTIWSKPCKIQKTNNPKHLKFAFQILNEAAAFGIDEKAFNQEITSDEKLKRGYRWNKR